MRGSVLVAMQIRALSEAEVGSIAVEWARREGWNPGIHDGAIFARTDPGAFLGTELDGRIVATHASTCYGERFAFMGFYIVTPEHRGQGLGLPIWSAGVQRCGDRNIGLDGVLERVEDYRRNGFEIDYRNRRYRGRGGGARSGASVPIAPSDVDSIVAYDARCFPAWRERFVRDWVAQDDSFARVVKAQDAIRGYAVMRKCFDGWKIGPLFADEPGTARALFDDLRAEVPGQTFYLDVPAIHDDAVAMATGAGMEVVFETARMYTRGRPPFALERCFGVTTFELG